MDENRQQKLQDLDRLMLRIEDTLNRLDQIMDEDREAAITWYTEVKDRYMEEGNLTSEEGKVETAINGAMSNVIKSTDKAVKLHDSIAKLLTALVKERALLKISMPFERVLNVDDPSERLRKLEEKEIRQLDHKVSGAVIEVEENSDDLFAMPGSGGNVDAKTAQDLQRKVENSIYEER